MTGKFDINHEKSFKPMFNDAEGSQQWSFKRFSTFLDAC